MDGPHLGKPRSSQLAIASLVLGFVGLGFGFVTGIPAIISGHVARARICRTSSLTGAGKALAGLILGYVTTFGSLAIILLLSALTSFSEGLTESAREQVAKAKLREILAKVEVYRLQGGIYPSTAQGLEALVTKPRNDPQPRRWQQQFQSLPEDPWGQPYIYKLNTADGLGSFEVFSKGPDAIPGTVDDISTTSFP